jgi:AraC-like DNA-binding protein
MRCRECDLRYVGRPGSGGCLGHVDGVRMFEARCGVEGARYGPVAAETLNRLVLPRSGAYLLQVNGEEVFVDSGVAVLTRPGDELRVAHPLGCGDTFTALELEPALAERWPLSAHRFVIADATDLDHRVLVAECRQGGDALAAAERIQSILGRLAPHFVRAGSPRPATMLAHRRLVTETREILAHGGWVAGLNDLAVRVNSSPHHLSRIFRAVTGETLTDYRNRMRVRAVLSEMQDGADNLRTLAGRYGFADQAHLTRVVRRHLGRTPSALKRLLE